jgi:hypothetical protein
VGLTGIEKKNFVTRELFKKELNGVHPSRGESSKAYLISSLMNEQSFEIIIYDGTVMILLIGTGVLGIPRWMIRILMDTRRNYILLYVLGCFWLFNKLVSDFLAIISI